MASTSLLGLIHSNDQYLQSQIANPQTAIKTPRSNCPLPSLTSFSDEQLNNGIGQPQSGIPNPLHPIRHRINQASTLCEYKQTAGA